METTLVKQAEIEAIAHQTNTILQTNQTSVEKAKQVGEVLISKIQAEGMSEAIDQECNDYLVKVKKTYAKIQEARKPITQLFDNVKKLFTNLESDLDPKGDIYLSVQGARDEFARKKAAEANAKEEEARKKLEIEKEKTSIRAQIEISLAQFFNGHLTERLNLLQEIFDKITLSNSVQQAQNMAEVLPDLPSILTFNSGVRPVYISHADVMTILGEVYNSIKVNASETFEKTIKEKKDSLYEMIPTKEAELKAIEKAEKTNKEEADRLKAEKDAREKLEKEKLDKESAERDRAARDDAERKKAEVDMNNLFNASAEMTGAEATTAQVRKSLKIIVTHPAGYVQIFQLWFEREGASLGMDKLEKKTLLQMKTFCEGLANKEGTKIQSNYIKYEDDYKAIAKS